LIIEVYLVFTNVCYSIQKTKYLVSPVLKNDHRAKRYHCVADTSRAVFLVWLTIYNFVMVGWPDYGETAANPCEFFYRVPYWFFYMSLNCRIIFACARSVLIKYCLNMPYMLEKAALVFELSVLLVWFIWSQATFYENSDNICISQIGTGGIIFFAAIYVICEITSFMFYYMPLRDTDKLFGKSLDGWANLLTTTEQQLAEMEDGRDELEDDRVLVVDCPLLTTTEQQLDEMEDGRDELEDDRVLEVDSPNMGTRSPGGVISQNSLGLISKFHKTVRRNFFAGVWVIIAGTLQCALFVVFDGSKCISDKIHLSKTSWYFGPGFGRLTFVTLSLILYVCMMLTDNNWGRAFIPIFFWHKKAWA